MIVLGLNAFGHDAAAVLLADGEVAFAASEERFDRQRHSAAFPMRAIEAALAASGLVPADVDVVAFPWTRHMAKARKACWVLSHLPRSLAFLRERPDPSLPHRRAYLSEMRGLEPRLRRLGFRARVVRLPHHEAHAWSAGLALPAGNGAAITADGMGEWTTTATWHLQAGRPRFLRRAVYPHSAGKVYAAVTAFLGFRPECDEGKTMGLAAYGDAEAGPAQFARTLLAFDSRRLLRLRQEAFGFPWGQAQLFGDAFLAALGPPRTSGAGLRPGDASLARGLQSALERIFHDIAREVLAQTHAGALALAGGLFLNCSLNGFLHRSLPVPVYPFPVAGDAGAAWGAAAAAHHRATGRTAAPLGTLRLGSDLTDSDAQGALSAAGLSFRGPLAAEAMVPALLERLVKGEVLALARGRAEFGPRALGARSLIALPSPRRMRDRVNDRKGRERWRPLAPLTREGASDLFEGLSASPYMILTFPLTALGRRLLPAALHADQSARVQTLAPGEDPLLEALLAGLVQRGLPPVLLNTSLNRRGEPIANTAAECIRAAASASALVLGSCLYEGA